MIDFLVDGFSSTRSRKRLSWSGRSEARMILPSAVQWAGRTTPTRSVSWNAPGAGGARDHDHRIAHSHGKMAAFAGFARQILQNGRREIDHLDLVERAGRERKQRPADAIALGVALLPDVAERHHGLWRDGRWWNCAGRPAWTVRPGQCLRGAARSLRGSRRRGRATARRRAAAPRPRRRCWARSRAPAARSPSGVSVRLFRQVSSLARAFTFVLRSAPDFIRQRPQGNSSAAVDDRSAYYNSN